MEIETKILPRQQLSEFLPNPRAVKAFEDAQNDITNINAALTAASFVVLSSEPSLGSERVLTGGSNIVLTDHGANAAVDIDITDTAVTAGAYGSASETVSFTVDAKGRITAAAEYALNTDNVTEGGTNLFFTNARARSALSGGSGIDYNSTSGVIATTGFSGTVSPVASITVVNGIVTAVS